MQIDRDLIESSLETKGFVKEETHHRYFYHEVNGKRTSAFTFTSHGSSFKSYGDNLLQKMKKQLRLDSLHQVSDLFKCPMSAGDYNDILKKKGVF